MDITVKDRSYYESTREDMLGYITEGIKTAIEFGCGRGGFSELVKKHHNTQSWAVELDSDAARSASEKLDRVICADAPQAIEKLPDGYFDCVIMLDFLEHLVDPYGFLVSMKQKVSPGGIFVASIPNIRYYRAAVKYLIHKDWTYEDSGIFDRTHLRFFTRKSIVKTLAQLGFEIIKLKAIHPTSSRTFKILNFLLCNSLSDMRYKHFAVTFRQRQ